MSQIQIPRDNNGFRATLENLLSLLDFVFGMVSFVYGQVNKFHKMTTAFKWELAAVTIKDNEYIAQLMQLVDNKLKLFFMSCAMAKEEGDIGFHLLEFQDVANSILNIRALGVYLLYIINQVVVQARASVAAAQFPPCG